MRKFFVAILVFASIGCAHKRFTHNHSDQWAEQMREGQYVYYLHAGVPVFGMFGSDQAPTTLHRFESDMTNSMADGRVFHVVSSTDAVVSGKQVRYVVGEMVQNGKRFATVAYLYGGQDGQAIAMSFTRAEDAPGYSGVMKEFLDGLQISR